MSKQNVDIVRRYFDALNRGGSIAIDTVRAFCDPEITFEDHSGPDGGSVFRGHDDLERHLEDKYLEDLTGPPKEYHFEVEQLFDTNDEVVAVFYEHHHGWVSGSDITMRVGWVFSFRGRNIVRVQVFPDREDALRAVGLLR
jgi:ketosteroid isomerase-like protein